VKEGRRPPRRRAAPICLGEFKVQGSKFLICNPNNFERLRGVERKQISLTLFGLTRFDWFDWAAAYQWTYCHFSFIPAHCCGLGIVILGASGLAGGCCIFHALFFYFF
jgi:hypothetical protein